MSPKTNANKTDAGFTAEEKAAMKARAKELKMQANKAEAEQVVLETIAAMEEPARSIATRIHEIVKDVAPDLASRTWYGMPAYANEAGKVVCFFQDAGKFNARYSTFGFNDAAHLDDGAMWATSFALTELTAAVETRIADLVRKATNQARRD